MKKILCIALYVMMVMSLLAGCGDQQGDSSTPTNKHSHTWSETWSTNESGHWKSCSGCTMQAMLGAHMDDDMDGVCNDCGYEESCQHTHDEEKWMSDAENHWHPATCKHEGIKGAETAHVDENNDGQCDICEYFDTNHEHTYKPEWSTNESEHWHEASCGHDLVSDKAAHEDPEKDGVCDVCKWFDAAHTHTFKEEWTMDAGFHWYAATCQHTGATKDRARHADLDGDECCDACQYEICHHVDFDVDGACDICGFDDPEHTHDYAQNWISNHAGHWKAAQCHPGATTKTEVHVDENNDGNCDICAHVICSHVYKQSWSSNDTHHWYQLICTCSVETRKNYGEHVDQDDIPGCDVCMHGYQAATPVETIVDKQKVTIDPQEMITWQEVTIHIPKAGRYLITSDNTGVRWYQSKDQEDKPTSYASEIYFEKAGEVTLLAKYFDFGYATKDAFDIYMTVICINDLVLNTSRGKAELPTNMTYKVVFEAMEVGTWTLRTSVSNVSMGVTVADMMLATSVEVSVEKPGDLVELYVLYQDETDKSTFLFDWELAELFQLDVGLGMSPVSVPAEGDDYKVVFTAPEDGQFLLSVTNEYLSFSWWDAEGFKVPVRTESIQQLTPKMKKGETFTTWLQTVYDYPMSTNVNDTLTVINVGTLLTLGETKEMNGVDFNAYSYTAVADGKVIITLENGVFGSLNDKGVIEWSTDSELIKDVKAGETVEYYMVQEGGDSPLKRTITFLQACPATAEGSMFSFTAAENTYYRINVINGELGITTNGVTLWVSAANVDGQMISSYEVKMEAGDTYVFRTRSQNGMVETSVMPVDYSIDMKEMFNSETNDMEHMGKKHTVNMVPSKIYDISFPDSMMKLKVRLNWNYKGVVVYVDGEVYRMGTRIYLQDVKSITAKLQNNVAVDVTFSLTVTYAPIQQEAVAEGPLALNKDMLYYVAEGGQAKASYTAEVGGTYILTNFTTGARIYLVNEFGEMSELVLFDEGIYTFRMEANETVEFIILSADGKELTVQVTLTASRP